MCATLYLPIDFSQRNYGAISVPDARARVPVRTRTGGIALFNFSMRDNETRAYVGRASPPIPGKTRRAKHSVLGPFLRIRIRDDIIDEERLLSWSKVLFAQSSFRVYSKVALPLRDRGTKSEIHAEPADGFDEMETGRGAGR